MSTLFAFLHYLAAFTLVSALVMESILIRERLTPRVARQIIVADLLFGISAGVVLAAGLVRVFYFEKGSAYYFQSVPFLVKLALFVLIGLASAYPTREFLRWRHGLKDGREPTVPEPTLRRLRVILLFELAGVAVLILCASLMAHGVGNLA